MYVIDGSAARYKTATQAIRGVALMVREMPLTKGERKAFNTWYIYRNYRSAAFTLIQDGHYEMPLSIKGERRTIRITRITPSVGTYSG